VAEKKRLGRGLNEISHLFVSSEKGATKISPRLIPVSSLSMPPRCLAVMSVEPAASRSVLIALAFSLAVHRVRVFLVEMGNEGTDLGTLLGISRLSPSIKDYLAKGEHPFLFYHSPSIKLLSFHLNQKDFKTLPDHEREILYRVLLQEECSADFILVHMSPQELEMDSYTIGIVDELIFLVSPNLHGLQVYRSIKKVVQSNEGIGLGVLFSGFPNQEEALDCFHHLSNGVSKFLGVSIINYGIIPPHNQLIDFRMINVNQDLHRFPIPADIKQIGEKMVRREGLNPYQTNLSFFEKVLCKKNRLGTC